MDPNYANAGGGGVGIGGSATAAAVATSGRYNAAFYKDQLVSCQRSAPTPYNTYDPYGGSAGKVSSAYPYDAEAEFKERTGMGKTKVLAGNTVGANSAKIQHHQLAYNQNSCYSGSYSQGNVPESANYYGYSYEQQQNHAYAHQQQQQQQQQYHHQSQLQQQYKYNKLVAAQQQQQQHHHQQHQQQQQHHQHQHLQQQQQKISQPEYGYTSYHHPYYHPHYHHPSSTQKGVAVMKTIPDASSSMPYANSKMMTARAPQYPSNYNSYHHPQSSYPPVVTAGHQHTYQSQSVCDDSRWMWNSSGNDYANSSCRGTSYSGYVNGSGAAAKQQHSTLWPSHSMPIQYQSTGYPAANAAAAVMAPNQSCCPPPPPPNQGSTTTFYPQQYVKYPMHQSAADYNNDLYGNPSQSNSAAAAVAVAASGKVYTDLSGNSYQQSINSPVAFHHQQQQQSGEYSASPSSSLDYSCSRYLQQQQQQHQQQQQTESPSSLSSTSSSTSSYNHHYYHPYQTYSNVEAHQETYQQQVDTKIKSQSLRDFLTSWNEDEDEMSATTEGPFMEQLHLNSDHFAQDNSNMGNAPPVMENHLQFKGSFSSSSRPKIHVGITVDSTVESDQYINLPDIIIDIEKSNKDIVSLPEDCLVANIPLLEKDDIFIKEEEMPNIKEEIDKEKYPKKQQNHVQREKKSLRRKCQNSKLLRRKQRLTIHRQHRMLKVFRRKKLICPRVKIESPPTCSVISQQFNPKSLKCICVSLINSEIFRKRILGTHSEIDSFLKHNNNNNNKNNKNNISNTNKPNTTTDDADNEGNIDAAAIVAEPSLLSSSSTSSSSSVIPKLSDLCKNALNSSFDRDVLVINLDEILDSDNLFVVQCDINENILENFEEETEQLQQQQEQQENSSSINISSSRNTSSNSNTSINNANGEEEQDLVGILNDNNNNYNNSGSGRDVFTPVPTDIERLKRCSSVTEVSNLPLDNSVEHDDFILTSINNPLVLQPLQPPLTPPSPPVPAVALAAAAAAAAPSTDGSISCPATLLCGDGRGHDRHSHSSSSSLIEQNCLTQQQISVSLSHSNININSNNNKYKNKNNENENDENDNNQELHGMLSGIVQQHDIIINNKDSKTFLPPTAATAMAAFDDSALLLDSSKVVTTPSIHHEEIVPDNLKKFQNEKFLKYLHAKYVQGNLSEFYHANRIIKKYKKRIIKKLLNIVR